LRRTLLLVAEGVDLGPDEDTEGAHSAEVGYGWIENAMGFGVIIFFIYWTAPESRSFGEAPADSAYDEVQHRTQCIDPTQIQDDESVVYAEADRSSLDKCRHEQSAACDKEVGRGACEDSGLIVGDAAVFGEDQGAEEVEEGLDVYGDAHSDACDVRVGIYARCGGQHGSKALRYGIGLEFLPDYIKISGR